MNAKTKEVYLAPQCLIVQMSEKSYLMEASFPSQHRKADHASGPAAQAKLFDLWSDEHFEDGNSDESSSSWDD